MKREQVLPHVMADMAARIAKGADEYGEPLTTFNGRDALQDAYEEALDLTLYLKQAIMERDARGAEAAKWPAGMNSTTGYAQPYVVTRVDGPGAPGHVTYASTGESLDDAAKRATDEARSSRRILCDAASVVMRETGADWYACGFGKAGETKPFRTLTNSIGPAKDVEPWPGPDWSQAPEWAVAWAMDGKPSSRFRVSPHWFSQVPINGGLEWAFSKSGGSYDKAPDFGYPGDWRDSLRKRPK